MNDIEIVENDALLPEPTGEESIVPEYISDNSSVENSQTDEKILFFYSESSEKSKEFDAILQSDERPKVYSDIIKVNFDDESAAKENYGIIEANSFVLIDENGTLVKKIENV
jgi:cytochrome oxidase Cu insertion factor (SCO1/SenC/PrrC family)